MPNPLVAFTAGIVRVLLLSFLGKFMDYGQESLKKHKATHGKVAIVSKFGPIMNREDLSVAYTPGVAAVSSYLGEHPEEVQNYTIKGNTVAVISDGSAVLGLGNIGPYGALPVMEGKCILFKQFADIDAYPIVLKTQDTEEIIQAIVAISPTFGGINLEDIAAPKCFEIEKRLRDVLDIPIFHDDQHATAVVVLAALINALKIKKISKENVRIVVNGAGAAGLATTRLLIEYGIKNIIVCDSKGILHKGRADVNSEKQSILAQTNIENLEGDLPTALNGADIFIGLSAANVLKPEWIKFMNTEPVIFAMANPVPEIMPDIAKAAGAYIVGTGRSDFPNQINNVLVFPGMFRGLLDKRITKVTDKIKLRAAEALASCVPDNLLSPENIIPSVLDKAVAMKVSASVG